MVNKLYTVQHQNARRSNPSGAKRYSPPPIRNHSVISDTPNPHIKTIDTSCSDSLHHKNRSLDTVSDEHLSKSAFGRNISLYSDQFTSPEESREYDFRKSSAAANLEDQGFAEKDLSIINEIGRFQYILQMDREMGAHPDSIYRIPPTRTASSSKSNSINSSNHVNFWKADSEIPITGTKTAREDRMYRMQNHLQNFWKYAKWPLALILACIVLGVLIYFLAANQMPGETSMNGSNKREIGDRINPAQTIIGEGRPTKTKNILEVFQSNTKLAGESGGGSKPTTSVKKPSSVPSPPPVYSSTEQQRFETETTRMSTQHSSTPSVEVTIRSSSSESTERTPSAKATAPPTWTTINVIPMEMTKKLPMDGQEQAYPKRVSMPPLEITTKGNIPATHTTMKVISPKMTMKSISFGTTKVPVVSSTASTSAETAPTLPPFRNTQIVKISTQEFSGLEDEDTVVSSTTEITDKDGKPFTPTKDTIQVIGFTSGHQNNFGVPIEEDERILRMLNEELIKNGQNETFDYPTTDSTVTKVRVSPTIPIIHREEEPTESSLPRQNNTDVRMCRSTALGICRGILRYDLTTINSRRNLTPTEMEHFKYLIDSKCSVRAAEFVCSALEPECRPTQMGILQPCKRICKSILEPCASIIASSEILTTTFDCDSYPDSSDRNVCEDPTRRGDCYENEFKCLDSTCIPLQWKCDNIKDCSLGEDEDNCLFCEHEEFRCQSTDKCIPDKWRCDQYNDCPDGSDEVDCFDYDETAELSDDELAGGPRIYSFSSVQSPDDPDSRPYLTISEEDRLSDEEKKDDDERPFPPTAVAAATADDDYLNENQTNETTLKDEAEEVQKGAASGRVFVEVPKNLANFQDSKEIMMTSDSERDYKYSATNETTTTTMRTDGKDEKDGEQEAGGEPTEAVPEGSCPENKLRCVSGKCITVEQICDKTIDCPDGADEAMCVYKDATS